MTTIELLAFVDAPLIAVNLILSVLIYHRQSLSDLRLTLLEDRVNKLEGNQK